MTRFFVAPFGFEFFLYINNNYGLNLYYNLLLKISKAFEQIFQKVLTKLEFMVKC